MNIHVYNYLFKPFPLLAKLRAIWMFVGGLYKATHTYIYMCVYCMLLFGTCHSDLSTRHWPLARCDFYVRCIYAGTLAGKTPVIVGRVGFQKKWTFRLCQFKSSWVHTGKFVYRFMCLSSFILAAWMCSGVWNCALHMYARLTSAKGKPAPALGIKTLPWNSKPWRMHVHSAASIQMCLSSSSRRSLGSSYRQVTADPPPSLTRSGRSCKMAPNTDGR